MLSYWVHNQSPSLSLDIFIYDNSAVGRRKYLWPTSHALSWLSTFVFFFFFLAYLNCLATQSSRCALSCLSKSKPSYGEFLIRTSGWGEEDAAEQQKWEEEKDRKASGASRPSLFQFQAGHARNRGIRRPESDGIVFFCPDGFVNVVERTKESSAEHHETSLTDYNRFQPTKMSALHEENAGG